MQLKNTDNFENQVPFADEFECSLMVSSINLFALKVQLQHSY